MLIAFREVEDSLTLERHQIQRIERLDAQVKWAELASELLRERFITRDASFLDILSSVQSEQRLQRDIVSARLDLILIRIGLYLALAGDFDTCTQATSSTVLDLSFVYVQWGQAFMLFPMVKASELIACKPLLSFSGDVGGSTASAGAAQDGADPYLDLWNRDGRGPFFSPAVLPSPKTTWR